MLPIPWPIGKRGRAKSLVVYRDLVKAVRRESARAVMRWWSMKRCTVWKWRRALGVDPTNEGTSQLRREHARTHPALVAGRQKGQAKAGDPQRCAKIGAAKRGKPRPPHVVAAVRAAHLGTHHSEETRRKMSATHKARGTLVPGTVPFTPEEDELVRTLPTAEAAARTGRRASTAQPSAGRLDRECHSDREQALDTGRSHRLGHCYRRSRAVPAGVAPGERRTPDPSAGRASCFDRPQGLVTRPAYGNRHDGRYSSGWMGRGRALTTNVRQNVRRTSAPN
jgi:hypothetical protein